MNDGMSTALQTLLYGYESSGVDNEDARLLFMNAEYSENLPKALDCQSYFKPYVDDLSARGYDVCAEILKSDYDHALYLLPKNMLEARYNLARVISSLKRGGIVFCAADNKAGGSRLKKLFEEFGIDIQGHESRNKGRVIWGRVQDFEQDIVAKAIELGAPQKVIGGEYVSQSGVFGWDKIDKGSEILTHFIPKDLKGKGADFGCGYGYLSNFLLLHCSKVKRLACLDADYRAVEMCKRNLAQYDVDVSYDWADLTKAQPELRNLDFIVMNPPFHEGKKQDIGIGADFIKSAYQSLKRGGALYIVANAHLPYETILDDVFFAVDKLHEGQGFKVFKALR